MKRRLIQAFVLVPLYALIVLLGAVVITAIVPTEEADAQGVLAFTAVATYSAQPADSAPTNGTTNEATAGVFLVPARGKLMFGYTHSSAATSCDITPWLYDRGSQTWWSAAGSTNVARYELQQETTLNGYYVFLQTACDAGPSWDTTTNLQTLYAGFWEEPH